ncbi:hypothetical protein [Streptomyces sp. NPDC048638]|uniref:hypothetical protein n=1 Tax=Streptomyces sp. NPDC048638 TaxID=3365580 RepID=UPI003712F6D0
MSSKNITNRQQIARDLNKATGCGYQQALERVIDAAERNLLPPVLNAAGRAAAVRILTDLVKAEPAASPLLARDYLKALLSEFRLMGWGAGHHEPELEAFGLTSYAGPVAGLSLSVGRAGANDEGEELDPDDPEEADLTRPLYLMAMCPSGNTTVEDFEDGLADCSSEAVRTTARRLDTKLGETRLGRVRGAEEWSTTSCPICGDRYPEHHLLRNSRSAEPVCPACIFDGDQGYRTDLPYLAVELDRLLHDDLAAPAGWDAVAAVLALSCGPNLGARLDRELKKRGGWPFVMERWGEPLERSWIWLPPPAHRHEAFKDLGAGATVAALVDAVDRHDPTARATAKALCRESEVRWRDSLWPAAIAFAVAFTTQGFERDRHRTPFHVVHSLSDGLEQTMKPFAVTGDASNIEYGLEALLKHHLFPVLLGHSLDEEPDDPRRRYGAQDDDDRPAPSSADAHLSHGIDRAHQVAVVLGKIPFTPPGVPHWDGAAAIGADARGLGSTAPANDLCRAVRDEARQQAAEALYDLDGCDAVDAEQAWTRNGWWIPSDHAAHAVRQAQQFLGTKSRVLALWFGPGAQFPEPAQVCVDIIGVNAHSTGPRDVPWLQVSDGRSVFGLTLSDVALIRRAEPGDELTDVWLSDSSAGRENDTTVQETATSPDATDGAQPTLDELSLLTNQFLHLAGHRIGEGWKEVDAKAYAAHQRLEKALEAEYTGFLATGVKVWINLFDTAHPCPSGKTRALPAYALTGKPYEVEFNVHKHDPSCGCGQEYGFGEFSDRVCQLLIVLCLYGGLIEVHPMIHAADADDPDVREVELRDITWEVDGPDGYDFREVQRRVIRDMENADSSQNSDTNPTYVPPYMAAAGWYLPEGGTSMMFHGRRHEDETG